MDQYFFIVVFQTDCMLFLQFIELVLKNFLFLALNIQQLLLTCLFFSFQFFYLLSIWQFQLFQAGFVRLQTDILILQLCYLLFQGFIAFFEIAQFQFEGIQLLCETLLLETVVLTNLNQSYLLGCNQLQLQIFNLGFVLLLLQPNFIEFLNHRLMLIFFVLQFFLNLLKHLSKNIAIYDFSFELLDLLFEHFYLGIVSSDLRRSTWRTRSIIAADYSSFNIRETDFWCQNNRVGWRIGLGYGGVRRPLKWLWAI